MSNLADSMEEYLKKLLTLSASGYIDVKRKELASKFNCVPSQVNYVLETRFTLEKGYLVESRRGGKGFIRIRKLRVSVESLLGVFWQDIFSGKFSDDRARGLINRLYDLKYISFREARLMEAALESLGIVKDKSLQETLKGWLIRDMLLVLIKLA